MPADALSRAAAAVERGELATALALALPVWRACPDPDLAHAIEAIGRALPPVAPLPEKGGAAAAAGFAARAGLDDPADLGALLAAPLPRTVEALVARLRVLAARAPDPRFASYLHELLAAPPFGRRELWAVLFELVVGAGDPRSIARLEQLGGDLQRLARASLLDSVERKRERTIAALRKLAPVPRALSAAHAGGLALLEAAVAAHGERAAEASASGAALLAAIHAHPEDDRARAVYGDWLSTRGDPRGELLALQLAPPSPATDRRVKALLAAHGKAWLGPLAAIAVVPRCRFERGFPVAIVVNARTPAQLAAAVGAAEWITVEDVRFSGMHQAARECAAIVCDPVMGALRAVHGLSEAPADLVATAPHPLRIETLGLALFGHLPAGLHRAPSLPRLRHVIFERLQWVFGIGDVVALAASPLGARLSAISTRSGAYTVTVERRANGELGKLRVDPGNFSEPALAAARAEVDAFAAAFRIAEVELVTRGPLPPDAAGLRTRLLGGLVR